MFDLLRQNKTTLYGASALTIIILILVCSIPFQQGPLIFETLHHVTVQFLKGNDPYSSFPQYYLYKYSPTFLLLVLTPLAQFEVLPAAILWQFISVGLWFFGLMLLLAKLPFKTCPSWGWMLLIVFSTLHDIFANSVYLQSNAIVLAGMMFATHFYQKKHWALAALMLAFVTNMKIFPIVFMLLLFCDRQYRFIMWSVLFSMLFAIVPYVTIGIGKANLLYQSWMNNLIIDRSLIWGEDIHHYLSIKPFSQLHFNYVWGDNYIVLLAAVALVVAWIVVRHRDKQAFSTVQTHQILALSLSFILLFNTRTEGPSLVFLTAIYPFLWSWIYTQSTKKRFYSWLLTALFILTSLSTTDIFRNTWIQQISWDNNLRALGILFLFIWIILTVIKRQKMTEKEGV